MASARVIAHQRTTPSDGIGARGSRQARVRMAIAGTGIYLFVYLWRAGCRGMSSGDGVVASIIDINDHRGAKRLIHVYARDEAYLFRVACGGFGASGASRRSRRRMHGFKWLEKSLIRINHAPEWDSEMIIIVTKQCSALGKVFDPL